MSLLFFLSLFILFLHIVTLADIGRGLLRMTRLTSIEPEHLTNAPRVSVIVPACNEADTIEVPLLALLDQDYPNLEIIVVNDRSTDATPKILKAIQQQSAKPFSIINIQQLTSGWLGKSHALQRGADKATGDYLLFTDADIEMEKSVISRAVTAVESDALDHLSLIFQTIGGNWLLNGMVLDAASGLLALFKPWNVKKKSSRYFMGVGAFNMVRANVYRAIGGHTTIRMHPIDDIMLGKIIKENGYSQDCFLGQPLVKVCWYSSVSAMVDGLMKNVFSVLHYRVWLALLSIVTIFILTVLPVLGALYTIGITQLFFTLSIAVRLGGLALGASLSGMSVAAIAGGFIAPVISMYIVGRTTLLTIKDNGIYWRGTYYPLEELRQSRPLLF